jgi:hypothetical protein
VRVLGIAALPLQSAALECGALLWHMRLALVPAGGDDGFAAYAPFERQLCERLWREVQVPLASGSAGSGTGPPSGSCLSSGPLVASVTATSPASETTAWSEFSPAVLGIHTDHRVAREASRELVAIFCFQNPTLTAVVLRMLPPGFAPRYFSSAVTGFKPPSVNLLDSTPACDDALFFSPRARVVWPEPPAPAANPPRKGASAPLLTPTTITPTLLSTSLWSGDADVPVALGRAGCLWWDAALCAASANKAQRLALAARVKVCWLGVTPQVGTVESFFPDASV